MNCSAVSGRIGFLAAAIFCLVSRNLTASIAITVDPATPLTNAWSGGEWNTDGNFESWTTTQITNATVAGGTFSGAASGVDAQVSLLNFAGGPDLDLGFNDSLDLRLQLPADYLGDVQIRYGVTNTPGISDARLLTIPAAQIPKDGAFHVYRLELELEPGWRGNLRDLRLDPFDATGAGKTFALDYLRVGDLSGEVYLPRYTANCPAAGGTDPNGLVVTNLESKHFRFVWDGKAVSNSFWTANMPHGTLRNVEEAWQVHIRKLGYKEPATSWTPANRDGKKYKVNVTCYFDGYWAGGDAGDYGWLNITPDGLRVDPPTWVIPHEFMHVCQMHQRDGSPTVDGPWWESHANFAREQWIYHYAAAFDLGGGAQPSNFDSFFAATAHFYHAHGRHYYLCWPIFLYLDENPDNLPDLGFGFTAKIWQQTAAGEFLYDTIARLSTNNSRKDILGNMARRNVTWNYSHKANLQAAAATGDAEFLNRWVISDLVQRADDTNWWRVPPEKAPMQGAYTLHELKIVNAGPSRGMSVNFHGLANTARGADWRVSFVVVNDSGVERYSPPGGGWSNGVQSVSLASNENKVYLAVAATPDAFPYGNFDDTVYPYQSHPQRVRFPYEIQFGLIAGGPVELGSTATNGLVKHANGGGWKASTATVDATAYLGPNARVLNTAKVRGNARIEDYAIVENSALVTNNAVVSGHAVVRNTAVVKDNAKVRDYAMIIDSSVVAGDARVLQRGRLVSGAQARDWATVKGCVEMWRDSAVDANQYVGGDAVCDGDFSAARTVTNGFQFGFLPYNVGPMEWITNRTAPRRLYAAYEFNAAHESLAKDLLGVTDGYLIGNPTWVARDGNRSGVLGFNGTNQAVALDRSVSDLREITVTAWVKWGGGASNQPVWFFGAWPDRCMYLTPDDGAGHAKFVIISNNVAQSLAAPAALPAGVWTHVAVTLSNGVTGRLYVNGTNVQTGAITFRPDGLNAPNVGAAVQHNYLARGGLDWLPFFKGSLDGVRIYTGALTDAEIAALLPPPAPNVAGTLYVDLRATNSLTAGVWTNFGTLGNFTGVGGPVGPVYTTNAAATGVPAMTFNGTAAAFNGPNSVADLDGASDRSIEVWACNPSLGEEETMVSWGHRSTDRRDLAFNFGTNANWGAVTHWGDDLGWGTVPSANAWHHLVYTYSNSMAKVYVDGVLQTSKTLGGALNTFASEPVNIGCQRDTAGGTRSHFFSGYLNTIRVHGGVLTADQVAGNFMFGPWLLPAPNQPPQLAAISSRVISAGITLAITNAASDPDAPPQTLAFSLASAPAGAAINTNTGVLTWRPAVAQANSTNQFAVKVADNGTPSLSATQSFSVAVSPLNAPAVSAAAGAGGHLRLSVGGDAGPDYSIQTSTNLSDWATVFTTNSPALPFGWTDAAGMSQPALFYRVMLGP